MCKVLFHLIKRCQKTIFTLENAQITLNMPPQVNIAGFSLEDPFVLNLI